MAIDSGPVFELTTCNCELYCNRLRVVKMAISPFIALKTLAPVALGPALLWSTFAHAGLIVTLIAFGGVATGNEPQVFSVSLETISAEELNSRLRPPSAAGAIASSTLQGAFSPTVKSVAREPKKVRPNHVASSPVKDSEVRKGRTNERVFPASAAITDSTLETASSTLVGHSAKAAGGQYQSDSQRSFGEQAGRYEALVAGHLLSFRRYPERARRRGLQGTALVQFSIRPDGTLDASELLRSSAHEMLDQEALRLLERAVPFPQPPPQYAQNLEFKVPITFSLH
jgi:TonB family protein